MPILDIVIYKNKGGQGTNGEWCNSYPIDTAKAIDSPEVIQAANLFASAEREFALDDIAFSRAVISTRAQEAPANRADGLKVIPLNSFGQREPYEGAPNDHKVLPLDLVLKISHAASRGRSGQASYRGFVGSGDWSMETGVPVLVGNVGRDLAIRLQNLQFPDGVRWGIASSIAGANGYPFRQIVGCGSLGIGVRQRRNSRRGKGGPVSSEKDFARRARQVATEVAELAAGLAILEASGVALAGGAAEVAAVGALGGAAAGLVRALPPAGGA